MSQVRKQTPDVNAMNEIIGKIKTVLINLGKKGITLEKDILDYFWKNHADIMGKYPFLVAVLCSGEDKSMLDLMLYKLKQIQSGDLTHDQADTDIGKQLANDYLPDKNN